MPAANMTETLQLPALQVPEQQVVEGSRAWSSSSTPTLRRKRFKMRRMKNVQEQSLEASSYQDSPSSSKEYLQLPSIEITPSSDEDTPWSNCSTPSASPRRKRFLLRKWLRVREKKECSESSSQQSSQQSSHDDDSSRFLSPRMRDDSTASNSNRSTPACSPILRKRSRSPTPQDSQGDTMVEKGSDHSSDKSPSTPEQGVQRSCSSQSGRSGAKNSKKSQSWYNVSTPVSLVPGWKWAGSLGGGGRCKGPLCPKELWHFVHQCYGNELGLTSDDEDYVPPDDDFNTMGYCEEIPVEENEVNDSSSKSSMEAKPEASPQLPKKSVTASTLTSTGSSEAPASFDGVLPEEEEAVAESPVEKDLGIANIMGEKIEIIAPVNSPSLDFNDNEDIPTELSDSSETHDEGEVQAFYEDLNGRQYVNEVFNFSVDKLYDLLFTDSQFQRDFMEQRRFSDIIFHPWKKEENGNQTRVILYTITLTNPLAPKTATVTETQTMYKASQESECYVIDAEVLTHDVPYHDYFYTINRYTLTRVARNKSRLRVSTELRYRKQPWGLVKSFIEKNFWSGLEDYFRHLESELTKTESTYLAEVHRQSPKEKVSKQSTVRRRKRAHAHLRVPHLEEVLSPVTTPTDEEVAHRIKHVAGSTQTRHIPEESPSGFHLQSVSKLLLVISFVLVLLVILNMMLFYKLWMLEYTTQTLTAWQGLRLQERLPQSQTEWAQLLESQQKYHDSELQKWREIIKSSVMLLDQMKDSLINLQNGIGSRDFGSDPEEKRKRFH
uniref:GRAM domain containing 1B n=1 Tax=Pavo cristatus TaxID=9049 RepID=A0A8C9G588_PAVCR